MAIDPTTATTTDLFGRWDTLVAAADTAPNRCRSMRPPAILDAPAANLGLRIAPLAKERLLK